MTLIGKPSDYGAIQIHRALPFFVDIEGRPILVTFLEGLYREVVCGFDLVFFFFLSFFLSLSLSSFFFCTSSAGTT
jgi:hypothetical protein